jgi:hypothetical protein
MLGVAPETIVRRGLTFGAQLHKKGGGREGRGLGGQRARSLVGDIPGDRKVYLPLLAVARRIGTCWFSSIERMETTARHSESIQITCRISPISVISRYPPPENGCSFRRLKGCVPRTVEARTNGRARDVPVRFLLCRLCRLKRRKLFANRQMLRKVTIFTCGAAYFR